MPYNFRTNGFRYTFITEGTQLKVLFYKHSKFLAERKITPEYKVTMEQMNVRRIYDLNKHLWKT